MQTASQTPAATEVAKPILTWLGHSSDHRTNRWKVTCPKCRRSWEPRSTMFGSEGMTCPKNSCAHSFVADYNSAIDAINARDRADAQTKAEEAVFAATQ